MENAVKTKAELLGEIQAIRRQLNQVSHTLADLEKLFNTRTEELHQTLEQLNFEVRQRREAERKATYLTIHDDLTGLSNRREFYRRLKEEVDRAKRYEHTFSLCLLDLDRFKSVNDTYGFQAGDQCLRNVAGLIKEAVRTVDLVARYGGEEFALILPETPPPGALTIADRVRRLIATTPIQVGEGQSATLTTSIGIAAFPKDQDTPEKLVSAAETALCTAKRSGANRMVLYAPSMAGE